MADEAVIDSPSEVVAEIDNAVDTSQQMGTEGEESTEQTGTEGESGESLRGSALWREVKSLTQEGKPLTPKQLSALNKAIHKADAIESKYPDGLSAIESTVEAVRQLAEDETAPLDKVIEETLQERNYFRELDSLFTNGKPEFVDKMAEASPEAFQNIAPAVFRKYAEVNPEGYSAYVAQAVVQHMNSAEVPLQFRILASFLPQLPDSPAKEQVLNAAEALFGWVEGLRGMAAKKIEQKAIPGAANGSGGEDREQQLAQREMNVTRLDWNSSIRAEGVNFVMSEAQKVAGKTPLSEKEKQTVLAKVGEEMEARLTADRRYGEAMQGYLKAGNRSGYIQRIQSERKKLIPGAVRRAVADVVEARPKGGNKTAGNQDSKQSAPVKKPVNGQMTGATQFRRIAGPPRTLGMNVDLGRTTHTMLTKRQAYIVGQKEPVQWGPLAKA